MVEVLGQKRHGIILKQDGTNIVIDKTLENCTQDVLPGDTVLVRKLNGRVFSQNTDSPSKIAEY